MVLCNRDLTLRGKYKEIAKKTCHLPSGHDGRCEEFPYLSDFSTNHPRVANKIKRDSTKTTGAAWSSEDAGPNRIDRWVMLQSDETLLNYGINMAGLKPGVIAKLREKSATYEDCMSVAVKLTWLAYQMPDAPACPESIKVYLEARIGNMRANSTTCIICRSPLSFSLFENAQRGKAEIETAHSSPREHNERNVGFAHRECNIAQGNKTLGQFYDWILGISNRIGNEKI